MIPPAMLKLAAEKSIESTVLNPKVGDIPTFADKIFSDAGSDVPRFEKDSNIPNFAKESGYGEERANPEEVGSDSVQCDDTSVDSDTQELNSCVDDKGNVYKDGEGNLFPDAEYEVNGSVYKTDDKGRIVSAEGYLKDTPDNNRDNTAQSDAGGKDRKPDDDGGHLKARVNGGASGNENLVAMRDTVNRGDYKRSENEENQMLKDGKHVYEKVEIFYGDDSSRPTRIEKTYTDGEKTVTVTVDNVEGSTDLLETLNGDIPDQDSMNLQNEIMDMKEDGNDVSVTSVRREYDTTGNLNSVTVCVTNETTGEKDYTMYAPGNGGKDSNE